MIWIGIDPGLSGAIAIMFPNNEAVIHKMPKQENPEDLQAIFDYITDLKSSSSVKAILETPILKPVMIPKACPHCKRPVLTRTMQKGIITSFVNYGIILGYLLDRKIPFEEVEGSKWKQLFKLEKTGKAGSIKLAKQLFPGLINEIKNNDDIAEAILISEYGRRKC